MGHVVKRATHLWLFLEIAHPWDPFEAFSVIGLSFMPCFLLLFFLVLGRPVIAEQVSHFGMTVFTYITHSFHVITMLFLVQPWLFPSRAKTHFIAHVPALRLFASLLVCFLWIWLSTTPYMPWNEHWKCGPSSSLNAPESYLILMCAYSAPSLHISSHTGCELNHFVVRGAFFPV